ncbi:MAG: ABC transporter permease [Pseudomonadota bacterium]
MTDQTASTGAPYLAGSPTAGSLAPAVAENGGLVTVDGKPLKKALAQSQAQAKRRAFILVAPLLLFIIITFIIPIGRMLYVSAHNDAFAANMPTLSQWFSQNPDVVGVPEDEAAWAALHADLVQARKDRNQGKIGTRVNYDLSGSRSLFTKSARRAARMEAPFKEAFAKLDKRWSNPELWGVMRRNAAPYTASFYYKSLDLKQDVDGAVMQADPSQRIYRDLYWRTIWISALITGLCLMLAFPIAHMLATLPLRYSNLLMIMVLLPFWTSLLVRTTAWIALLQGQGIINDTLVAMGIVGPDGALTPLLTGWGMADSQGRVPLMYNQAGTIIAMTHILLPFMVLPLYSVMKTIPPSYVRAARSLGASQWTAFWKVYFPQTVPGIGAGVLLVFILALGYYITPALVGGAKGTLISNIIAEAMGPWNNWSLGAALGAILLVGVLALYWLYDRMVGIDNMKFG